MQASGAVLTVLGGLLVLLFVPMLFLSGSLTGATIEELARQDPNLQLPGGEVRLLVQRDGAAVPDLPVDVQTSDGASLGNGTTDAAGWYNATLGDHAIVRLVVVAPEGNFTRGVVALEGSATTLRLDVAHDPQATSHWAGLSPLLTVVRILLAFFLAVAALLVAAGICAMRLRAWGVAVFGGAVGVLPVLLLFVASLSIGMLLVLLVIGLPVWFIARGRRYFQQPKTAASVPPPPQV